MKNPELDIVMPVYNEGENILDTLNVFERSIKTPFRLFICYDFDEDNTLVALKKARYDFEIILVKNQGVGVHGAIMTGFKTSKAPAILMFPADESYNAVIIDAMYSKLKEGNDVVGASRFMKGGFMKGGPLVKSFIVRAASFVLRRIVRFPASDASYALRMFSRRVLDTVEIESTAGFTYAIELLVKCHRLGWGIAEVPAKWLVREKGKSRFNLKKWLPHYAQWFFYALETVYGKKGPETVPVKATDNFTSKVVTRCEICGYAPLLPILFLGYLPLVNDFRPIGERPKEEASYPAEIVYCDRCHLVQSGLIINSKIIFPASHPYVSGATKILRDNFTELYRECVGMFALGPDDLIVDIGSNDGNLLSNFKDRHKVLGVTPEDMGRVAIEKGIPTILDYFSKEVASRIAKEYGAAKIVTATNVFAHMDNVNEVVESILAILKDDGLFISESIYLPELIRLNQFDTVYHEHLRHYSLHSLGYLLEMHGLEIIHAKKISSHAGSIRVYASRKGRHRVMDTVAPLLEAEKNSVLQKKNLLDFRKRTTLAKLELASILFEIKKERKQVYGIGAPCRGTTLIHCVGIDEETVGCVLEMKGSNRIGKYVPGTMIPVLEESRLYADQPEYALIFSWPVADEIIPKLKEKGFRGKYIVPLPAPRILD
ncbi:MAG: glycosyltransferase [Nanoarchaeota archaeon]|nr:glycosyltransferase [Nanoarchaeota archaeon]